MAEARLGMRAAKRHVSRASRDHDLKSLPASEALIDSSLRSTSTYSFLAK